MSDIIIVKAKIKEFAKCGDNKLNVSGEFAEELDKKVKCLIQDACRRAKENNRNTVMKKDL
jgi:histone H3/H4